eukprot:scaffold480812_cov41-Prasinocladus_malaysianus.AAC.2
MHPLVLYGPLRRTMTLRRCASLRRLLYRTAAATIQPATTRKMFILLFRICALWPSIACVWTGTLPGLRDNALSGADGLLECAPGQTIVAATSINHTKRTF